MNSRYNYSGRKATSRSIWIDRRAGEYAQSVADVANNAREILE